jgi:hypothetical protein
MGPIGCPETSVRTYRFTLRVISEEHKSITCRDGSMKSFNVTSYFKAVRCVGFPYFSYNFVFCTLFRVAV